jgi:hypothetical protein
MSFDIRWMDRDLVGYGPDRPDAKWPNGAKIAVNCEWPFRAWETEEGIE